MNSWMNVPIFCPSFCLLFWKRTFTAQYKPEVLVLNTVYFMLLYSSAVVEIWNKREKKQFVLKLQCLLKMLKSQCAHTHAHTHTHTHTHTHSHCFPGAQSHEPADRVHHSTAKLLQYVVDQQYETSWGDFSPLATVAGKKHMMAILPFFIFDFKGLHGCFSASEMSFRSIEAFTNCPRFLHHWKVSADSCFCLDNSTTPGSPSLLPSHFLCTSAWPTLPDSCRKPVIRENWQGRKGGGALVYSG